MNDAQLRAKARFIQLQAKKLLRGSFIGDYRTKKKGFGLEFQQLADYQLGDDIRFIDWKSSARSNKMLVKEYCDDRNRTIVLMVDSSRSMLFGSTTLAKKDALLEVAMVIAYAALYNNDAVGLIIFADDIQLYIPPKTGNKHIHYLVDQLINYSCNATVTNINRAVEQAAALIRQQALIFLLSDYIDIQLDEKKLLGFAKKHDVVAMRCLDTSEQVLVDAGFLCMQDLEDGQQIVVDTRSSSRMSSWQQQRINEQNIILQKCGVDYCDINPARTFIDDLVLFLRKRMV